MYRLTGPIIVIFIPVVLIGVISVAFIPNYFNATRILSLFALLIGEAGLSFIPVLAFYPKATPVQAFILAIIFFFTALIMCFAAWGINSCGIPGGYAFVFRDGEFYINTYALFAANIFALIALVLNFRLVYDEELTKEFHTKAKREAHKKKPRFSFATFQSAPPRPEAFQSLPKESRSFQSKESARTKSSEELEEDFIKPFEFEPEIEIASEKLPEESSGKLFYKEPKEKAEEFDVFGDVFSKQERFKPPRSEDFTHDPWSKQKTEESESEFDIFKDTEKKSKESDEEIKKPKNIQTATPSPFPPQNIKEDLQAIFEQYSSLNSVKKLTSGITDKPYLKKKEYEKKGKKPYLLSKPEISVHIAGEDVHEATFRDVSEEEKLNEIKEELKKELKEIKEQLIKDTQKQDDKTEVASEQPFINKEETIEQSIDKVVQEAIPEKINQEDMVQNIKDIKEELMKTLKEEIKKELIVETGVEASKEKISDEEKKMFENILAKINAGQNIIGSLFLDKEEGIITELWHEANVLGSEVCGATVQQFNSLNYHVGKTMQGNIYHVLLESDDGMLVLANIQNKILSVYTRGTGEVYSGQILKTLQEVEEVIY